MDIYNQIIEAYPELTNNDFGLKGSISLQDDADNVGAYITKWEYSKPIPEGLVFGKPSS